MNLDYSTFADEIVQTLDKTPLMILATSANNKVTARNMAIVNNGLTILFQTSGLSEKAKQIEANPNIAFATGNIQVEAVARISTDPEEVERFIEKYKVIHPGYYEKYSGIHEEVLVVCTPTKFAKYKFVDGKPCTDILDVKSNRAYREILS